MILNFPAGTPENKLFFINCGCKINLRLKVTGKRQDKLHDLSSCFLRLDEPGDRLTLSISGTPGIDLSVPDFPELAGKNNLVYKAAELFAARSGIVPAWHIVLEKRVPIAAGLGGGSADAGGMLALLNRIYRSFSPEDLASLAFSLGADVPFFLNERSAWVTGAGEFFEYPENLPELPEILIVNPGFPVSAGWAYTHLAKELISADDLKYHDEFFSGKIKNYAEFCRNDLAPAIFDKFPLLRMIREHLAACGALAVQVSGSGPSLFALFESDAAKRAKELREKFSDFYNMRIFTGGTEW